MTGSQPLTVGTAGHVDHGKTALVRALTGVDTDRLPEEKARGLTIVLGFAPLTLGGGRTISLVDVPGHERLVRVMVSGATGIDLFLLVVAADDGPMPQTIEHVRVLHSLGVQRGVVAITKSDRTDPAPAAAAARRLVPGAPIVTCSARTGEGVGEVGTALDDLAATLPSRNRRPGATVLHLDRVFSIRGAGTVVTGTLQSGVIDAGDRLRLLPAGRTVRVRGLQVHGATVERAVAGERVAVNLASVDRTAIDRGDALVAEESAVAPRYRIDAELRLDEPLADRERVQVHHGTRAVPARAVARGGRHWQLRLEEPLLVAEGDRVVVRRISPPDTLGGGVVVTPATPPAEAPSPQARTSTRPPPPHLDADDLALEQRLRAAGHEPLRDSELGDDAGRLPTLRATGRAVRVGRAMHAHPEAIDSVRALVETIVAEEGSVTLGRLRDRLGTSRRYAQALLEHLDSSRVTRRQPDDSRVLRRR